MKTLVECTLGNSKYRKNKTQRLRTMIVNMGSAHDCPSAKLGLCQLANTSKCYAFRDERMYKQCLPYRRRQGKQWKANCAGDIAKSFSEMNGRLRKKVTHLRLNESGDFASLDDFAKACAIAKKLHDTDGIETFVYTARRDILTPLLLETARECHMTVNGSGFMAHNNYRVVPKGYKPANKKEIYCQNNCHICRACKTCKGLTILTECRG